jgi:hypothetical protein
MWRGRNRSWLEIWWTFCLGGGHTLLHDDRDFDPMEELLGLAVLHRRLKGGAGASPMISIFG